MPRLLLVAACVAAVCSCVYSARDLQAAEVPVCTYQILFGQFLDINPENTLCLVEEEGASCDWDNAGSYEECQYHCNQLVDCVAFFFQGRAMLDGSMPSPSCLLTGQTAAFGRSFPGNIVGFKNPAPGGLCGN
mmetsp:Transcript_16849/g.47073  ORF Transcript_16849/g.47073 Transcript_16849/m.47073 type:complete len:133 (-) Transcript_16849:510-908(-)|eukprot:CAMPEP_0117657610 /NCGR_PEP_ID=MMETSP0804-20121206/5423_1 /TAXON_ID=1074897 /ORGANISM="Tetraselmis astigmatica, Strain CCMP880" /LENGTH=132 /DNA_ID=CAMNT_0005464077 /DNA_START=60 /DNA_END=458 /DNA_ORIENTATION=-